MENGMASVIDNTPEWVFPSGDIERVAQRIVLERQMPLSYARVLACRGIRTYKEAEAFVSPSLDDLKDPFLFEDMRIAVDRLKRALRQGEHIMVLGDYDVDGVCGTALFMRTISSLGANVSYYIPNRFKEGYGVSTDGVDSAAEAGATLIMTVDSGVTAFDEAEYSKKKGIDFIITDHHEPQSTMPEALAMLNPKIEGCRYPFRELAGVGVMFKLLQALYIDMGLNLNDLYDELDLVALGTAADVVPLCDENRILTKFGIERMKETSNTGLAALMEISGSGRMKVSSNNIIHIIAPRLNAPGRLSSASKTVDLLVSNNWLQALRIAADIEKENAIRREMNDRVFEEANAFIGTVNPEELKNGIVLASEKWHQGVIGIAASRIVEKYNLPAILISLENGIGKGSARSIREFDICAAINECDDILENYGGHKYAVGLTIEAKNIPELKLRFGEIIKRELPNGIPKSSIMIDTEIDLASNNQTMIRFLDKLAPFGESNPIPIFLTRGLKVVADSRIVGKNHLKFKVSDGVLCFNAIAFNMGERQDRVRPSEPPVDILYYVEENEWMDKKNIQLVVKAIR